MAATDLGAEREIDLRRLFATVVSRWWIVAAGLAAGIVVGALYSLSGGSLYTATARIAPGQAFNPSGNSPVLTYLTNQTAINEIATSEATLEQAASAAGLGVARLRGHVTTKAVSATTGTTASTRNAVLVDISVRLNSKKQAEEAADAIAEVVRNTTTSRYVRRSIGIYATRIAGLNMRLKTVQQRIAILQRTLKQPNLSLDERLLLAIQLDQAQATQGQTIDSLATQQQAQILAEDVERTQIVQGAKASKSVGRSRRNSILVGGLIGLLLGAIAAIVADPRLPRPRT